MGYDNSMSKGLWDIRCPCCEAMLRIDPETRAVISHKVPEKPKPIEDLAAEVAKLKGAAGRRDEVFQKQVEAQKMHAKVLDKKFDEFRKAHLFQVLRARIALFGKRSSEMFDFIFRKLWLKRDRIACLCGKPRGA